MQFIKKKFHISGLGTSVLRKARILRVSTLPLVLPVQSTWTLQFCSLPSGATADASAISDTLVKHWTSESFTLHELILYFATEHLEKRITKQMRFNF